MARRARCGRCERPRVACLCPHLPAPLAHDWPVLLVQHKDEARHPLGTAIIASLGLRKCQRAVVSDGQQQAQVMDSGSVSSVVAEQSAFLTGAATGQGPAIKTSVQALLQGLHKPLLLYPGPDSEPLQSLQGKPPGSLVLIDATWRKSRRILHEHPSLAGLPRYHLPAADLSRYRIRKAPGPGYLSTLEALVAALACLQGNAAPYQSLLAVMDWMVSQQIAHMGEALYRSHYGGDGEA